MLTNSSCIPEKKKLGDTSPPNYICLPNGDKHYLSLEEKKDYQYGGKCPVFCPIKGVTSNCPSMSNISDKTVAKNTCEQNQDCHFIGNALFDRYGPNYCVPRKQPGCITLTESDLTKSDSYLTDNPNFCDRLHKGCIFNRGNGDGDKTRSGEPTCLRGCLGSKYWKNPDYMWGGGESSKDSFEGAWFNSDLMVGPKYLESAPSNQKPNGWGGPQGTPWWGKGKLPKSLGVAYTQSMGKYSPPCNINEGDIGVFTSGVSGTSLAGPGCILVPPKDNYGIHEWSYVCNCPYLGGSGEFKQDAWTPCSDWELDESVSNNRDVCAGCYIMDNKESKLNGHCVLGEKTMDTESNILGCVTDPKNPNKCRVNRVIEPTECPAFCSYDATDPTAWRKNTQCSDSLAKGCWKINPEFSKIISLMDKNLDKQAPPYKKTSKQCKKNNTDYLCRNCAQTPMQSIGSGTKYPNRSYCLLGGNESSASLNDTGYGDSLARQLSCPPTCGQCLSGFFGEPLEPHYVLSEASNSSSAFSKGIIYTPSIIARTPVV